MLTEAQEKIISNLRTEFEKSNKLESNNPLLKICEEYHNNKKEKELKEKEYNVSRGTLKNETCESLSILKRNFAEIGIIGKMVIGDDYYRLNLDVYKNGGTLPFQIHCDINHQNILVITLVRYDKPASKFNSFVEMYNSKEYKAFIHKLLESIKE